MFVHNFGYNYLRDSASGLTFWPHMQEIDPYTFNVCYNIHADPCGIVEANLESLKVQYFESRIFINNGQHFFCNKSINFICVFFSSLVL